MAVQRKVFRIEERVRGHAPAAAASADGAGLQREFVAELRALRAVIAPSAPVDRNAVERARAQIAEAQAYRRELELIHAAVARTQSAADLSAGHGFDPDRVARAVRDLQGIVAGTERATQDILAAAEGIAQAAEAVASGRGDAAIQDIRNAVVQILEACNFHDITGQRVGNVLAALRSVEDHATRLLTIWQNVERFEPLLPGEGDGDRRFLNGPKLPEDRGHSTQDDIDRMFVRA